MSTARARTLRTSISTPPALTDGALVDAIRANERRLHALALRMLGDHHAAEDAVQEASLRAFKGIAGFRGQASLATWLHRITANVCIEEGRRRRPAVVDGPDDVAPLLVDADFSEALATRAALAEALAAIPRDQQEAFVLIHVWGLDYAEAGALLGIPAGTVGSRVHRAKKAIRSRLTPKATPTSPTGVLGTAA